MVSVLFCRKDSIYKILGCDVWDIERNATLYTGPNPVICHPPCRAWGCYKGIAKPRPGEKELAVFAVSQVRKFGGVLEHPRGSSLWKDQGLPTGTNRDDFGGFSLHINQHWFGHKAEKKTLLYIVGTEPTNIPEYPISLNVPEYVIDSKLKKKYCESHKIAYKKRVTDREREATPVEFAKWLIKLAELCRQQYF